MNDLNNTLSQEVNELKKRAQEASLPDLIKKKIFKDIVSLQRAIETKNYDEKYEKVSRYIQWVLKIPWTQESVDRLNIDQAREIFNSHHHGMQEVKDRFLEYISVLKLRQSNYGDSDFKAPVLLLVGLVGTGKTTFAYSLADALNREIVRIPFGGMSDIKDLRGSSRLNLEAEPGKIIKGICEVEVRNPVFLLDEIDRVAKDKKMDIMGVLVELLDPAQNNAFRDHYIDHPVDLSHAIFIATANNTRDIATAVMDRVEKISMPSYSDEEKIIIGKKYILPKLLKNAGIREDQFIVKEKIWPQVVRPLGYDAGIRTLQRTLEGAVRKTAMKLTSGDKKVIVDEDNKKEYLPSY